MSSSCVRVQCGTCARVAQRDGAGRGLRRPGDGGHGTHFEVVGDQDFAEVRDIEVLDVESGQSVTYDADPERWARNLPYAFRSGDLICRVIGDEASEAAAREAMATRA